jgi:hypothetical protein
MSTPVQAFMAKYNMSAAYDPNDPLTSIYANLVALYANTAQFANNPARSNATLIEGSLRARQLLYYKKTPGDCSQASSVGLPSFVPIAKGGLATASTVSSALGLGLIGGVTAGIGLALVPVMAILQHHAQAVAKEQATLCEVTAFVNSGFQAVAQANVDWATRKQYFNQITQQGTGQAQGVTQKGSHTCNAGCMMDQAILALRDLYIMLYATPPSSNILPGIGQSQQGGPTATNSQGGAIASSPGSGAVVAGAAVLGAHFAGVF